MKNRLVAGLLMYACYADLKTIKVAVATDVATMRHYAQPSVHDPAADGISQDVHCAPPY